MENNTTINTTINANIYFKTDENKAINEKYIRWIKKMNNCLEVCTKSNGCVVKRDTHRICKINSPDSYDKLNKAFE
jgi:hypothetical protein